MKQQTLKANKPRKQIKEKMIKPGEIYSLLRVHHYIKNFFIFTPVIFSLTFTQQSLTLSLIAFFSFSLIASSIYIFNDVMDIEEDKKHPRKKHRIIASGVLGKKTAITISISLIVLGLLLSLFLSHTVLYLLIGYLILNILYSIKLKHLAIVDLFIIATGFVLRVLVGAAATDIYVSMWLILMTFLLALFLALSKRRDDVLLMQDGISARKNIDGYNLEFINASMVAMSATLVVCYILYTISDDVVARLSAPYLYASTAFVILGIMRYMQISFVHSSSESPTSILLTDRFLQVTIALWLMSFYLLTNLR